MRFRKGSVVPARLERARQRFESWRRTRDGRAIPEELWISAVKLAADFGVYSTARALRLNYDSLKKRVDATGRGEDSPAVVPSFCELVPAELVGAARWLFELEDAQGTRLRIRLEGGALSDVATLTRGLWSGRA